MAKKKGKELASPPAQSKSAKELKREAKKGKASTNLQAESDSPRPASTARPTSGKTPISLLHEHAQRSKWGRVEYDMVKVKDGMVSIANLSWIEPKTKEVITVKVKHNIPGKETPIEARYFAACVALHRISFNKNLAMVLPREFKDTWAQLEEERKQILKSDPIKHGRLYNNDPFKVVLEDRKSMAARQKNKEIQMNNDAKVKKAPVTLTSVSKKYTPISVPKVQKPSFNRSLQNSVSKRTVKFPKKVWDSATTFNFTSREREQIHNFVKSRVHWEKLHDGSSSVDSAKPRVSKATLLAIGFRESHAEEALTYKDPLSFLLFNVPDDDLPQYFLDSSAKDTITLVDRNERIIQKISEFGISRNQAIAELNMNQGHVNDVLCFLTLQNSSYPNKEFDLSQTSKSESAEQWDEEIESLSMIYEEDKIIKLSDTSVEVKFNDFLSLIVYKPKLYPFQLSGLVISVIDKNSFKLPNYIKLKITHKLADYAIENLIGDAYIFSMVDWLQQHSEELMQNPGPLLEPSLPAHMGNAEVDDFNSTIVEQRKRFRSRPDLKFIENDNNERIKSKKYATMLKSRQLLPAWNEKNILLDAINSNSVSLITGETGSGKSTQLVQFILDDLYSKGDFKTQILCTQPRRISAIGLAERVAEERAGKCGDEVGYIIRGTNKSNKNTKIKFLTSGILVKFLQNGDEFLNDSILVLDEVHERSMETDLIIIMIRKLLGKFRNLKVILMSATVDVSVFRDYFKGLTTAHIKGRTFPIKDYYLDDVLSKTGFQIQINNEWISPKADSKFFQTGNINYDLITQLVQKIDEDLAIENNQGSILIFLPGVGEINRCVRMLQSGFCKPSVVLPLHSALTPQEQHKVFESFPNKRKIVVSTNIAETSITINDCIVTIDSGRVKSMTYNSIENTTKLVEVFESKAEAKQRRGRAGRVQNGISYKLFTKETEKAMIDTPIPEIKRINLDSLYLVVKSMGIKDVIEFLGTGMDPPPDEALSKSDEILKCSGLIDEYDDLTQLGKIISLLPIIDPKHGKLLTLSIIFGCADIGILTASVLSSGSPFLRSIELRDSIKSLLAKTKELGDLLSTVLIVQRYLFISSPAEKKRFMNDHHLSFTKLTEIKSSIAQLTAILEDLNFLPLKYKTGQEGSLNRNTTNFAIIKAVITGAFYPQVARVQLPDPKFFNTASGSVQVDPDAKMIKYWVRNEEYITDLFKSNTSEDVVNAKLPATRCFIHPSSVLFDTSAKELNQSQLKELLEDQTVKRDENGLIDFEKLQSVKIDLTPQARKYQSATTKSQFVVFNSSSVSNKLYIRDITPTTTLSTLLFGGPISYDLTAFASGRASPGIVVDSWLPVKTWCKNAVLIKELRILVDEAIRDQLDNPSYNQQIKDTKSGDILVLIDTILNNELR